MEPITTGTLPENQGAGTNSGAGTPTANQGGSDKRFSQEEVNEIIKGRLSRYADYDELRNYKTQSEEARLSDLEKLQKKVEGLTPYKETATRQQKVLDDLLQEQLDSVPDNFKTLIPESFDTLAKLDYIRKNRGVFGNPTTPSVPANPNLQPSNIGLFGGKYSSLTEYASKDPKGYAEYRKNNKLN